MKKITNYNNETILLAPSTLKHIEKVHSEIDIKQVRGTLQDPDEVRLSSYRSDSELYYLKKTERRFICVVVNVCENGNFVSTAMTTSKPKAGKLLYQRER